MFVYISLTHTHVGTRGKGKTNLSTQTSPGVFRSNEHRVDVVVTGLDVAPVVVVIVVVTVGHGAHFMTAHRHQTCGKSWNLTHTHTHALMGEITINGKTGL